MERSWKPSLAFGSGYAMDTEFYNRLVFGGDNKQYLRGLLEDTAILAKYNEKDERFNAQWSYELFHSRESGHTTNTQLPQFKELRSDQLESFRDSLVDHAQCSQTHSGEVGSFRMLYNKLAAVVQDYQWDVPDLASPQIQKSRNKKTKPILTCSTKNAIYLFCENLSKMSSDCQTKERAELQAKISTEMLPPALVCQLVKKKIVVNIVRMKSIHDQVPSIAHVHVQYPP